MDIEISLEDLLKNGSHFGHNKKRWNPKMEKYIYGEKNGTHILDLRKSLPLIEKALKFAQKVSPGNFQYVGSILTNDILAERGGPGASS